ncbi:hypothetical protein JW921_03575 [Candidatus Fermentibacterales bacterium]|nr:hypothetical protein [Candidatus Fermentibacterales bacterium]
MRKNLTLVIALSGLMAVASCGAGPSGPAEPETAAPSGYAYLLAVQDPALLVARIDAIVADAGIEGLSWTVLGDLIASVSPYGNVAETAAAFGLRPDGTILVFMNNMMAPNSFGVVFCVADETALRRGFEEVGLVLAEGEKLGDVATSSIASPMGPIHMAVYRDLGLFAGTRTILEAMIASVDQGGSGFSLPEGDALIYSATDLSSIGPMIAAQLNQYRGLAMSSMEYDPTGMNSRMTGAFFDLVSLFLTEAGGVESWISFGPERVEIASSVEFVAGSSLREFIVPCEGDDLSALLPAGETAAGRFRLDPATTRELMTIVADLFGFDVSTDMLDAVALMSSNTAVSMFAGEPGVSLLEVVAVYEVGDAMTLESLKGLMNEYIALAEPLLESLPWMTVGTPGEVEHNGRTYVFYTTGFDLGSYLEAMPEVEATPEEAEALRALSMQFPVWMTIDDGLLWLEMATEPGRIEACLGQGVAAEESVADLEAMSTALPGEEIAMALNLPAYMASVMSFTPAEAGIDLSGLSEIDSWLFYGLDFGEGSMAGRCVMDNDDLARAIGGFATAFSGLD